MDLDLQLKKERGILVLHSKCPLYTEIICKLDLEKQEVPHLHAWIGGITCCCEGPRDPLRGVAGLQSKIVSKILREVISL